MKTIRICSMAILFYATIRVSAAQLQISISGIVTDGNNPVKEAVVSLVSDPQFSDTTNSNGVFSISNVTDIIKSTDLNSDKNGLIFLHRSSLHFSIPEKISSADVMLHTVTGRCILKHPLPKNLSGSITVDLPKLSNGLYLVRFSSVPVSITRKLMVTPDKMFLCENGHSELLSDATHKLNLRKDAMDQLIVTKDGFYTKLIDISSYKIENLSITLQDSIPEDTVQETSLHKKYRNYFHIGAAIDGNSYRDSHAALWKEHFNAAVCENEMKWTALQPSEGNFQFGQANAMVNAARSNGMLVRGHVLVWFDQTPDWVFQSPYGGQASKQLILERIRTHVTRVMKEFKGRVYAWDVVNEAVVGYDANDQDVGEDLGTLARWGYRNSKWYQIAGEDHIYEAFKAAREADPDAKLFYNDFWNYLDEKREFIISFVKKLKEQELIDGVGLQCHLNISAAKEKMNNQSACQTVDNLEKEIQEYAALGLDVHITELDISIYTRDYTSDDQSRWYRGYDLNEEYQNRLAARYKEFFDMFRRNADKIQNVTFWGIADDNTWLSEFPSGRPDHPLLFDKHLKPKKAFDAIMNFNK